MREAALKFSRCMILSGYIFQRPLDLNLELDQTKHSSIPVHDTELTQCSNM